MSEVSEVAVSTEAGRIAVRKTYKLYLGGAFPRSESGRSYVVTDSGGGFLANAALASRKDARDAVVAARKAFPGWSGATAYNRGQVLYRVAEVLEGRRSQFASEVRLATGATAAGAEAEVDAAIDRWVWYAGWADKIAQVRGAANPVAGPYFNFSVPEPMGVVAILAPQDSGLLGLVSVIAPAIVSGNTVRRRRQRALPAAGDNAGGGAGHLRCARGSRQHPHRLRRRDRPMAGLAHGRERHRHHRRPGGAGRRHGSGRGGQPQARRPPPGHRLGGRAGHRANGVLPRDEDRLAPCRALARFFTARKLPLFFWPDVSRN